MLIALGSAVGHVCALPHHVHADEAASGAHHSDVPGETEGEGIADASCEVLPTSPESLRVFPGTLPASVSLPSRLGEPSIPRVIAVFVAASPPLFILHAALQI
jgi:hypothetical protein